MDKEQELRKEYFESNYPSGSAGYRRFMVDKIVALEAGLDRLREGEPNSPPARQSSELVQEPGLDKPPGVE